MTKSEIVSMAYEAGCPSIIVPAEWFRFAKLVAAAERENTAINGIHSCHSECQRPICVAVREAVAAEREACAKLLDEMAAADKLSNYYQVAALAIRDSGKSGK